ncbi:uncharacterized protein LOC142625087 [Castanea sativa]|uniref:uncharacterized protein LOC142625087 n=1 Tax=Castanea sativa TaxID=21020 RepID=UPI003F650139
MRKGFINGCRPFLGIDGCHLKGSFEGVLLATIFLDGNNGLFLVAVAIVEVECEDSWLFFLHHLDAALGFTDAVTQAFPGASHRLCCRHIYSNFMVKFLGLMLKIDLWAAAKAYNEFLFNKAIQCIRVNNEATYVWLMSKPKEMWARHAYDPRIKIDHVTNNMEESFNQWVGDLRAKPALTMLYGIQIKNMGRINKRFEKANISNSLLTPTIKKTLDLIQQDSRFCKVTTASDDKYQVVDGFTIFVVNLIMKTCACGYWKISGLPCKHATTYEDVEPPSLRRLPSRPRKNRRREPGKQPTGLNVARRSNTIKCQTCKRFGYNKHIGQRYSTVGSIRGTKETRTRESSSVGACANVMNNVVEYIVGLVWMLLPNKV